MAFQQSSDNPIVHRFSDKERIVVADYTVNVKDAFNMSYLYTMVHDWIVEEGWGPRDDSKFAETYYMQREHPQFGKELWMRWRLDKGPADRSKLFHYYMDMDWKILGLKNTELAWKGQKVETNKGEFEVQVRAAIVIDKDAAWKGWPFKSIKDLYMKRILRQKLLMHRKAVYGDAYRLRDLMMNYLKMETFLPMKEAGEFFVKRSLE